MLENVVAATLVSEGCRDPTGPNDPWSRSHLAAWIGELSFESHRLSNAGGVQGEPPQIELHRFAMRILAEHVQFGIVGIDLIDDEVRQVGTLFDRRRSGTTVPGSRLEEHELPARPV